MSLVDWWEAALQLFYAIDSQAEVAYVLNNLSAHKPQGLQH